MNLSNESKVRPAHISIHPFDLGSDGTTSGERPSSNVRSMHLRFASLMICLWLSTVTGLVAALPVSAQDRSGDLAAALAATPAGAVLSLPGGDWGVLRLGDGAPGTIRSEDPSNPARFSGMDLRDAHDLTLEGLTFQYTWSPKDPLHVRPFSIQNSRNIRLRDLEIAGDVARSGVATDRGYPWGIGLSIRGGNDIVLEDSRIHGFHRGIYFRETDRTIVRRNDLYGLRSDGMNFIAPQDLLVESNRIHDFNRSIGSSDHADMIQFWTNKTDRPGTNIVVRGNLLNVGEGDYTQSIFMRNEEVDSGRAGHEMFYRNVTIEQNLIINAHLHGITVGEVDGLRIRGNTLVQNPAAAGGEPTKGLWRPAIRVSEASRNVAVQGNIAAGFPKPRQGWRIDSNVIAQPFERMSKGHYDQIFSGRPAQDPTDPTRYAPLSGGPADRLGIGVDWLR